ncbi:MAG: aminodeoxychorismate synthase component I [Tannerellaceae bacterium]|jgi:para-aminobenzoate synthetase component 1|nr:aminodeoxychorismate synthase component I [Tannerellaceae bacterium]
MQTEIIKNKINSLASAKKPFLFAVDFELTDGFLIENPLEQKDILFRLPQVSNVGKGFSSIDKISQLRPFPQSYTSYREKFKIVMDNLKRGDSFLTNLTVKTPIETTFTLKEIFELSAAPYCLYVPGQFVCFSPERFVNISDGVISTNPMKGTINAGIPNAEEIILSDGKETAEHNTIVDLLRNDLGMVAENITLKRFRYIDKIITAQRKILQVSSEITGKLPANYLSELGDILFKILPAGSVSGAPKQSTLEIIRKAEQEPRGYYTGVFGYFDGEELDSAVMIRFIEENNGKKYFRSGGGITVFSDPQNEYNEVIEKIYLPFV